MKKLQATQLWRFLPKKKEWHLLCYTDNALDLFSSPPDLSKNNLVLGRVLFVDHPACTNKKTQNVQSIRKPRTSWQWIRK
jgi:hypothetical protein